MRLRIVTYNIHACVGMDGRRSLDRVARVLQSQGADLIALQEVDVGRARSASQDQVTELAQKLEMHAAFGPALRLKQGLYGNAILSRRPVQVVRSQTLPRPRGWPLETRSALAVELFLAGRRVRVINTHLGLLRFERMQQLKALLSRDWLGEGPVVLCGDFNATPGSAEYRRTAALLRDTAAHTRVRTYWGPVPMWRIDHIFCSPDWDVLACVVPATPEARMASDHLPLRVDLQVVGALAGNTTQ